MADNDWDLPDSPDDSFLDCRTQYNNAILNVVTNHADNDEPDVVHDRMWYFKEDTDVMQLENGAGAFLDILDAAEWGGMLRHDGANPMTGDLDMDDNALLDPFHDTTGTEGARYGRLKFKVGGTTYCCIAYALS